MIQANNEWTFPEKISFTDAYTYYSKLDSESYVPQLVLDCTRISEVHSSFIGFLITLREKITRDKGLFELNCSEYLDRLIDERNLSDYFFSSPSLNSFRKSA